MIKTFHHLHYEDYAINEKLFHWQTQSKTSIQSTTGQRYINHLKTGNKIALLLENIKLEMDLHHHLLT